MNGLDVMSNDVNSVVIFGIGVLSIFLFTTFLAAVVSNLVKRWFRRTNGNRRSDNNTNWSNTLVEKLTKIEMNMETVAQCLSKNGIARVKDVEEIKRIILTIKSLPKE